MDKIRNIVVVGLGALGTYYADAFQNAPDTNLYVLVDEERKCRYTNKPRILNGKEVVFEYVLPTDEGITADLIMICTKSSGMHEAIDMIENYVGDETFIVTLMNGVTAEELLIEKYGAKHVLHCIYLGDGIQNFDGEIKDVAKNKIFFGSLGNEGDDEQTALLDELATRAGLNHSVSDDMLYTFWRKFILIVGYNQTCAVFGTDYSLFFDVPESLQFVEKLIDETLPLAKEAGVENIDALKTDLMEVASKIVPDCMPSITQDRIAKRRMEVDIFSDEVIRRARLLGLPTPYNDAVSDILNIVNKQNGF